VKRSEQVGEGQRRSARLGVAEGKIWSKQRAHIRLIAQGAFARIVFSVTGALRPRSERAVVSVTLALPGE
jgi:hypothetical protein